MNATTPKVYGRKLRIILNEPFKNASAITIARSVDVDTAELNVMLRQF